MIKFITRSHAVIVVNGDVYNLIDLIPVGHCRRNIFKTFHPVINDVKLKVKLRW